MVLWALEVVIMAVLAWAFHVFRLASINRQARAWALPTPDACDPLHPPEHGLRDIGRFVFRVDPDKHAYSYARLTKLSERTHIQRGHERALSRRLGSVEDLNGVRACKVRRLSVALVVASTGTLHAIRLIRREPFSFSTLSSKGKVVWRSKKVASAVCTPDEQWIVARAAPCNYFEECMLVGPMKAALANPRANPTRQIAMAAMLLPSLFCWTVGSIGRSGQALFFFPGHPQAYPCPSFAVRVPTPDMQPKLACLVLFMCARRLPELSLPPDIRRLITTYVQSMWE